MYLLFNLCVCVCVCVCLSAHGLRISAWYLIALGIVEGHVRSNITFYGLIFLFSLPPFKFHDSSQADITIYHDMVACYHTPTCRKTMFLTTWVFILWLCSSVQAIVLYPLNKCCDLGIRLYSKNRSNGATSSSSQIWDFFHQTLWLLHHFW